MLRWLTAGESHGRALVAICEGLPAGIEITTADIAAALARRRAGYGRGARMKFEQDDVEITGGVRHGRTLGAPVAIRIANTEWPKWETVMSPDPVAPEVLEDQARGAPLTRPRPGHADLAGMQKYGHEDARPVLERASARETAARVALGEVAKSYLRQSLGIEIVSHVVSIGHVCAPEEAVPGPGDAERVDADPVRCLNPAASEAMRAEIDAARMDGDTLGGVVEVIAYGVPPGLGSHVHWDRRLDARLAAALMSIQAMKGVEIGDGFEVAGRRGSEAHDEILWDADANEYTRGSTRAGGTEGGMTTGALLVARVAMKPLATLNKPVLKTVNVETKEETVSFKERTDVTAVPASGVVAETMVALVVAAEALRKFGGDSVNEFVRNHRAYLDSLS
jgi:chorismate synthase